MKKKHVIILVILALLFLGAYFGISGVKSFISSVETNHQTQISAITISNVDLSRIKDGTYTGSYKVFPVAADVKVVVKNHRILDIELTKHRNGKGAAAEVIPSKVVEVQTLTVDVITGATSSSKVILKAIENALNSAIKESPSPNTSV